MAKQVVKLKIPVIAYGLRRTSPSSYSVDSDSNVATIDYTSSIVRSVVFFDINITNIRNMFNNIDDSYEVQSAVFNFYSQQDDDTHYLYVGKAGTVDGDDYSLPDFFDALVNSTPFYSQKLQANNKQYHNIPIGSTPTDAFCIDLTDALLDEEIQNYFLGIYVNQPGDSVEIANEMLAGEDTEWAENTDVTFQETECAYISIELKLSEYKGVDFDLYYTNIDPASLTATSKDSLGGYSTEVSIYTSKSVLGSYSPIDTTISIDGSGTPDETMLCQIGPEIVSASAIDNSTLSLQRGPNQGFGNYGIPGVCKPSKIQYLDVDALFGSSLITSVQYKCVALKQVLNDGFQASNVELKLIKSDTNDFVVDIGIEVPRHDSYHAEIHSEIDVGDKIVTSIDLDLIGQSSGFFNGSHITVDPDGDENGPFTSVIESFSVSSGIGEFVLADSCPGFSSSTRFIIHPAPSQRIKSDDVAPGSNSELFFGFLDDGGSNVIDYNDIRQNGAIMKNSDLIYIWIKRGINVNSKARTDTGAVIVVIYN